MGIRSVGEWEDSNMQGIGPTTGLNRVRKHWSTWKDGVIRRKPVVSLQKSMSVVGNTVKQEAFWNKVLCTDEIKIEFFEYSY